MSVTIVPTPCGKQISLGHGGYRPCDGSSCVNWCSDCTPLGDRLVSAAYAMLEFSDSWPACLAWNLTLAALLRAAARHEPAVCRESGVEDIDA